jgi:hypothetical protein
VALTAGSRLGLERLSAGLLDQAIHFVERAVTERDPLAVWGRVIPFWDTVGTLPHYEAVTRVIWE